MGWMQSLTSPRNAQKCRRISDIAFNRKWVYLSHTRSTLTVQKQIIRACINIYKCSLVDLRLLLLLMLWLMCLCLYCCVLFLSHANEHKRAKNWRADSPHQWIFLPLSVSVSSVNIKAIRKYHCGFACMYLKSNEFTSFIHSFIQRNRKKPTITKQNKAKREEKKTTPSDWLLQPAFCVSRSLALFPIRHFIVFCTSVDFYSVSLWYVHVYSHTIS